MAKHLTLEQRELLHVFFEKNMKQFCIAKKLGIHQSTISRELKRNKLSKNKYSPSNAFYWYKLRKIWSKQNIPKWHEKPELLKYVVERLRLYWSPDQISKRIRLDFPNDKFMRINHESIYQYIWKNKKQDGSLYKYLRFSHIKRKKRYGSKDKRGVIPNRKSINDRPDIVNKKERVGDWESDLIIGKNHEKAIATYVERKTKILLAMKVESKQAEEMTKATIKAFKSIPEEFKLTMTHDNGKEIAQHEIITKNTHMIVYCANPYHSWERGLNENTNGLIRQFLPKKTDFTRITQKDVDLIVRLINNRPRKSLNYHTPFEVFSSLTNYAFQT